MRPNLALLNAALRRMPVWTVWLLGLMPLALLGLDLAQDNLGVDPIPRIEHRLGRTALYFLIGGLAITPLQRFAGVRLIHLRRVLGLLAFSYICLHVMSWALLDMGLAGGQILRDIAKRPYLLVGMASFVLLLPLALTSNDAAIRRLRRNWRRLHRLIYLAVPLAGLHYLWVGKLAKPAPILWLAVTLMLVALRLPGGLRVKGRVMGLVFALVVLMLAGLAGGAVHFQLTQPVQTIALVVIAAVAGGAVMLGPLRGLLILVPAVVLFALWYGTITPRNDRIWAFDVARGVTGQVQGDRVTLHNLRDFDWITRTSAHQRWRETEVDISQITSVDLITSVWSSPLIAHTLISFGFADGQHIVFSGEIRREKDELFSSLGGFFRQFELVMIAATESDIVHLRTNIRREDVSLYPLDATPKQARDLFLRYIDRANGLAGRPEFYNTLTSNCTTIIFDLARAVDGRLPLDWRIFASGKIAAYLHDIGLLAPGIPMEVVTERARISQRAQQAGADVSDFSRLIRQGGVKELQSEP